MISTMFQKIHLTGLGKVDTGKEKASSGSYHKILEELMRSEEGVGGAEWIKTIHARVLVTNTVVVTKNHGTDHCPCLPSENSLLWLVFKILTTGLNHERMSNIPLRFLQNCQ